VAPAVGGGQSRGALAVRPAATAGPAATAEPAATPVADDRKPLRASDEIPGCSGS
jgi:hypothetical protein